jgi:uncharacterized protein GlcG (DUF336 family)
VGISLADGGALLPTLVHGILARGHEAAARDGLGVAIAVVDAAGNLAGFSRHPEALLTSTSVAIGKAFTAANFRDSTEALIERIPAETRAEIGRADARLVFIRGGLPLSGGGGVGVSGATAAQDAAVAAASLEGVAG